MIVSGVRDNEPDDLQVYPYTSIYEGTEWTPVIAFKFALVDATGRPSRGTPVFFRFSSSRRPPPSRSSSRFLFLFSECPAVPSAQHCFSPPSSFLFHRSCPANQRLFGVRFSILANWTPVWTFYHGHVQSALFFLLSLSLSLSLRNDGNASMHPACAEAA